MSPQANTNTPKAQVARVRRRNNTLRVTYTDGRKVTVPQAVNGRFESRVSYGYDQPTGTYNSAVVSS
ncbi:hypothetical protein AB0K35_27735 [Micromonospora sp. NPDC053740]|uniref:hypothetical protein n=1 Tax=Micromonospora TaxID=1873 RepID=UPI001EE8C158|nr:hypothetical protein [Micromonospora alfalfae]MCG5464288.1 hypothetical protein [Micromonospora alfalfae]